MAPWWPGARNTSRRSGASLFSFRIKTCTTNRHNGIVIQPSLKSKNHWLEDRVILLRHDQVASNQDTVILTSKGPGMSSLQTSSRGAPNFTFSSLLGYGSVLGCPQDVTTLLNVAARRCILLAQPLIVINSRIEIFFIRCEFSVIWNDQTHLECCFSNLVICAYWWTSFDKRNLNRKLFW